MARSKNNGRPPGELRIIGGQWRSRKLHFTPADGLRPTSDRVRETLFNWLSPVICDARCSDLFAGSGALGLEALSRGARHCDFVETSRSALGQITEHLVTLEAGAKAHCHLTSAGQFLATTRDTLDIVFIDPPFGRGLVQPTCQLLSTSPVLAQEAWIYIETPRDETLPMLPENWLKHREKVAGDVAYRLFHVA